MEASGKATDVRADEEIQVLPIPVKPAPVVVDIDSDGDDEKIVATTAPADEENKTSIVVKKEEKECDTQNGQTKRRNNRSSEIGEESSGEGIDAASLPVVITISDSSSASLPPTSPLIAGGLDVLAIRQLEVDCLYELVRCADRKCKNYPVPSLRALTIVAMELPTTGYYMEKLPGMSMTIRDIYWKAFLEITKKYRRLKFEIYKKGASLTTAAPADNQAASATPAAKTRPTKKKGARKSKKPKGNTDWESSSSETGYYESEEGGCESPPAKRTRRQSKANSATSNTEST